MEKMIDQLPQDFTAAQRRVAIARFVADANPRDLMDAIAQEWPAKCGGKAQALAHARALVDMIEASK
jgi:predicted Zn-dependent protease with MMP-like domain